MRVDDRLHHGQLGTAMRVTYWTPPGVDREATVSKTAHDLNQGTDVTYHVHAEGKDCSETCWALPEEDG